MSGNISSTTTNPARPQAGWTSLLLAVFHPLGVRAPGPPRRGLPWSTLLLGLMLALAVALTLAWATWATQRIVALSQPRIVSVQLAAIMGEFVEAEARKGTDPATAQARIAAYLAAVGQAVEALGQNGTTVLVSEAVVAGPARDVTQELRADVARRLAASAKPDAR